LNPKIVIALDVENIVYVFHMMKVEYGYVANAKKNGE